MNFKFKNDQVFKDIINRITNGGIQPTLNKY